MGVKHWHVGAAVTAIVLVASFQLATVVVEIFGRLDDIQRVKTAIVWGLWLLIPSAMVAGITGRLLSGAATSPALQAKVGRMKWIALNGLLVLLPCAMYLQDKAASGALDGLYWSVQALELVMGLVNLSLLLANGRQGRRLAQTAWKQNGA